MDAHTLRILLVARSHLVSQRQATANTIRGLLKTFGLVVARGSKGLFPVRVREQIAGNPALIAIIEPLLAVWLAYTAETYPTRIRGVGNGFSWAVAFVIGAVLWRRCICARRRARLSLPSY